MQDPYFSRSEVSNSDLSALKKLLYGGVDFDPTHAYAFGTLIDNMITEPFKVDYFQRTVQGQDYTYSADDFERASLMKKAILKDEFCKKIIENSDFQSVSTRYDWVMNHNGFDFSLSAGMRCKWDCYIPKWNMGGDIKSTAAQTQSQFHAACEHFDYFRSRSLYMDIAGTDRDVLMGISKHNFKVFKIVINRGDKLYEQGKKEYLDLAFRYWVLFDSLKLTNDHQSQ